MILGDMTPRYAQFEADTVKQWSGAQSLPQSCKRCAMFHPSHHCALRLLIAFICVLSPADTCAR